MLLYITKLLKIVGPSQKYLLSILFYFISLSVLELFSISLVPIYIGALLNSDNIYLVNYITFFNSFISFPNPKISLGILLLFIFIVKCILAIYINKKILIFSLTQLKILRLNILSKYQQLDFLNFLNLDKSQFIYNNTTLTVEFTFTLIMILRLAGDLLIGFCIVIFLANLNFVVLFIFLCIFLILFFLFDFKFKSKLNVYGKLLNQSGGDVIKYIDECINGFKEIKILNKEQFFYNKVKFSTENYAKSLQEIQIIQIFPKYLIELFLVLIVVSFSFFWLVSGNQVIDFITIMSAFAVASVKLFPMFNSFLQTVSYLRGKKNSVDRLFTNLYDIKICKKEDTKLIDIKHFENFTIKNFSFMYPKQEKFIFKNSFFTLKKNESIGILGNSGEGKSTLVNIFSGLLQINSGQLIINNKNLDTNNIVSLKNFIAYLPQDIFFINGTIKENIALGIDPNLINDYDIFNALKLANAYEFVMDLPNNINSSMGEVGANFSGGEKQRIGIARAMYFNKEILIFDEITSSLDRENAKNIKKEILKLNKIKTMIIITHDPQLVDFCDKVYEVKNQKLTLIT
jgi:ABC-type multidrug transport system fused ATPase/permease subunit